jgi:hypothetical protein
MVWRTPSDVFFSSFGDLDFDDSDLDRDSEEDCRGFVPGYGI